MKEKELIQERDQIITHRYGAVADSENVTIRLRQISAELQKISQDRDEEIE